MRHSEHQQAHPLARTPHKHPHLFPFLPGSSEDGLGHIKGSDPSFVPKPYRYHYSYYYNVINGRSENDDSGLGDLKTLLPPTPLEQEALEKQMQKRREKENVKELKGDEGEKDRWGFMSLFKSDKDKKQEADEELRKRMSKSTMSEKYAQKPTPAREEGEREREGPLGAPTASTYNNGGDRSVQRRPGGAAAVNGEGAQGDGGNPGEQTPHVKLFGKRTSVMIDAYADCAVGQNEGESLWLPLCSGVGGEGERRRGQERLRRVEDSAYPSVPTG